jgi:[ribosomal protein S5]-alanine N-acetyltransferase
VEIKLSRCALRPWRPGDEPSLVRYADDRRVSGNLRDRFPFPYTAADATAWIAHVVGDGEPPHDFAIVVDGAAVGGIGVELGRDVFRRSAEIGYWLGHPFWGRGIASEALRAVTDYAFATFDIIRLEAGVFGWNPASARVLEKAGYLLEGRMRQAVVKDGRVGDRLLYGLLRP